MVDEFSKDEIEERKKAVFEAMSPRGKRRILKLGYENWNPFQDPKDPIDIRRDPTQRTARQLLQEFLQEAAAARYSDQYKRGVLEIALGMINREDRYLGMYDFSLWYRELMKKDGPDVE